MEMEGRSYSEMYRNTSEEMFIKTMMESPVGMAAPTMEMLGFKNFTQNFRTDSEEIFKSWLTTGENSSFHSTGIGHRPRQASRRISTELAGLSNQNAAANAIQKKVNDDTFPQTTTDSSNERNGIEKGVQATNLFLAKAWFHSCQPMTRSRSSELRRRYVAMQNSQTQIGIEACAKQQLHTEEANGFNYEENHPTHFNAFMSFNNNNPQEGGSVDKISSVVSMLKGTLDRKKLTNQVEREGVEESSLGYYSASCFNLENQGPFQDGSMLGDDETRALQTIEESLMEGIMGPLNHPTQMSTMSREPSQSESSAAVVSNGFDMLDDHCISAQAPTVCESSRNQMGTEDCSRTRDVRERIYDHSREDQKQESLVRYGSIKSSGSVERGDPTKKRRVERSRKMAEAKEKSSTPPVPSDIQSILKRCENLEKEVRSLKLNLAFMNRKDSEQTKQIEELQKENQELADEKERLLEEIERIISETGKM